MGNDFHVGESIFHKQMFFCCVNCVFLENIGDTPLSGEEEFEMGYNQPLLFRSCPG